MDPSAVKAGLAWVTKCVLMGSHMYRWNHMTNRYDFLYTTSKCTDELAQEWQRHKRRRVGPARRDGLSTASGSLPVGGGGGGGVAAIRGASAGAAAAAIAGAAVGDADEPDDDDAPLGKPGGGAPGEEGSDGARGKANPSPKGKPKGPTPKGKAKAKAKGKGKGKGWNAKANGGKDVVKEAQKLRSECFELVCGVEHLKRILLGNGRGMTTICPIWKGVLANFGRNAIQWSAMTWSWPNR